MKARKIQPAAPISRSIGAKRAPTGDATPHGVLDASSNLRRMASAGSPNRANRELRTWSRPTEDGLAALWWTDFGKGLNAATAAPAPWKTQSASCRFLTMSNQLGSNERQSLVSPAASALGDETGNRCAYEPSRCCPRNGRRKGRAKRPLRSMAREGALPESMHSFASPETGQRRLHPDHISRRASGSLLTSRARFQGDTAGCSVQNARLLGVAGSVWRCRTTPSLPSRLSPPGTCPMQCGCGRHARRESASGEVIEYAAPIRVGAQ
jgi:hypothetical protein